MVINHQQWGILWHNISHVLNHKKKTYLQIIKKKNI